MIPYMYTYIPSIKNQSMLYICRIWPPPKHHIVSILLVNCKKYIFIKLIPEKSRVSVPYKKIHTKKPAWQSLPKLILLCDSLLKQLLIAVSLFAHVVARIQLFKLLVIIMGCVKDGTLVHLADAYVSTLLLVLLQIWNKIGMDYFKSMKKCFHLMAELVYSSNFTCLFKWTKYYLIYTQKI